jgi:NADPH-dependent glutamate synthase beta subunit-like oxidoreductase
LEISLNPEFPSHSLVAVIGAGPAGLYAAHKLSDNGVRVVLFNRDIKPGGLAEYGIYPDKLKMKVGLRKQFQHILSSPLIDYYGNTTVCAGGNLTIYDLMEAGFQVLLVTTGAQGTKWLGLEGEYLRGVYHAKDLVYHYNRLPPNAGSSYPVGTRVALIGAGNVMMDIAHWLIREIKVKEVITVVRRGPMEVRFGKEEARIVAANFDLASLDADLARLGPLMSDLDQDPAAAREIFTAPLAKALAPVSDTRFRFEFLASPKRILGEQGYVTGLEVEDNRLNCEGSQARPTGLGTFHRLEVDTVIFCIGDTVDKNFCLPTRNNEYARYSAPRFPVDGISYEAFDVDRNRLFENIFLAGWARKASTGLVGVARHDGENGAQAVLSYLGTLPPLADAEAVLRAFEQEFERFNPYAVCKEHLPRLEAAEQAEAQRLGVEDFKFATNEEMLTALDIHPSKG